MNLRTLALAITVLTFGCTSEPTCPHATIQEGSRCVAEEAKNGDAGGPDARPRPDAAAPDAAIDVATRRDACFGVACRCASDLDCPETRPQCDLNTSECVVCLRDDDCEGSPIGPVCSLDSTCVECTQSVHCPLDRPVCQGTSCVQCRADADCGGDFCVDGTCEECDPTGDATCPLATAARCDATATCAPCTTNGHCAHLDGLPVCVSGTCVQCEVGQTAECRGMSCHPTTHTCTRTPLDSVDRCEPCLSSEECERNLACGPYTRPPGGGLPLRIVQGCIDLDAVGESDAICIP